MTGTDSREGDSSSGDSGNPGLESSSKAELTRRFWRLSAFNILANLMIPLAGLVDTALLGHLSQIRYLAGVALGAILFDYLYWTFGFLRMSTTGLTAQAMGKDQNDDALVVMLHGAILALAIGTLLLLFRQFLAEVGFRALQGSSLVEAAGSAYFHARIWGAPATLLNFVFLGWFLGREQGGRVLMMSLVGNGANVALDVFFIVHLHLAAAGAGAATAISQYIMLATALFCAFPELRKHRLAPLAARALRQKHARAAFQLNGDILVRTLALVSVFAAFMNIASLLGTVLLAATAVVKQVVTLAAFFIDGIAFATESLAGIFDGAAKRLELRRLLRLSLVSSFLIGIGVALVFYLFPRPLFGLLTNHAEVLTRTTLLAPWLFAVLGAGSLAYALDGYFIGLVKGRILSQAMLASALLGFVPIAILAYRQRSVDLLWLALSVFMVARVLSLSVWVPSTLVPTAKRSHD